MCRFLESIKLLDGKFFRLELHQDRMNVVADLFFPAFGKIDLNACLQALDFPKTGLYKCRIVYDSQVISVEFQEYHRKEINSLKIVEAAIPSLRYKPEDRTLLDQAFAQRGECDDILIVVDGKVKDSWYCNAAFYDGKKWFTPQYPIIEGVNRKELIQKGEIIESEIKIEDLINFQKLRLFNAMIEFGEIELPIPIFSN